MKIKVAQSFGFKILALKKKYIYIYNIYQVDYHDMRISLSSEQFTQIGLHCLFIQSEYLMKIKVVESDGFEILSLKKHTNIYVYYYVDGYDMNSFSSKQFLSDRLTLLVLKMDILDEN